MSTEIPDDQRRMRALSHPVRLRILSLLVDSPKSGTILAKDLELTQAAVSYHLRALARSGFVELDSTRSVRGGTEKLYRLAPIGRADGDTPGMEASVIAASSEIIRRLREYRADSWDVFSDAGVWIPEKSWIRLSRQVVAVMAELHELATHPRAPGSVQVNATALMFRAGSSKGKSSVRGSRSRISSRSKRKS